MFDLHEYSGKEVDRMAVIFSLLALAVASYAYRRLWEDGAAQR